MVKAAYDWDLCVNCSHTANIHKDGICKAYSCECQNYELKKGK